MSIYYDSRRQQVQLTSVISKGGEGEIWRSNRKRNIDGVICDLVAKIYYKFNAERLEKLQIMLANRPNNPTKAQKHISLAWIEDILFDSSGNAMGFLMPAIGQSKDLIHIYNPKLRKKFLPKFDWRYLHVTGLNLALVIDSLHSKDYIIGDIKPQNILVNDRARISIVDTDSFQVKEKRMASKKYIDVMLARKVLLHPN